MAQRPVSTVTIGRQGRIVIPAAIRHRLGLRAGDQLTLREANGQLELEPKAAAAVRLQGMLSHLATDVSVVDELIAERREEARREDERDRAYDQARRRDQR